MRRSETLKLKLDEIKAEIDVLTSDDYEPTEEDISRTATLADEFDKYEKQFNTAVEIEKRTEIIRAAKIDLPAREQTAGGEAVSSGDDQGTISRTRGYKGTSHTRNPYENLAQVRRMQITPNETISRALDAIEQAPDFLTDDSREHATNLVQRSGKKQGAAIARHLLMTGSPEYFEAFEEYLADPTNVQRAALSLTSANGGYLVPFTLDPSVILTNSGSVNPYRQISTVKSTATNTWNGVASAGMNAAWLAEAAVVGDNSPTFSNIAITPQKAAAWVFGSYEILEDSDFATEVPRLLADAKDRLEENAFAVGNSAGVPKGAFTAATTTVQTNGTANTTGISVVKDFYDLQAALPPRFRSGASWVTSLQVINIARGFDTAGGSSYWTNLGQGSPEKLLGGNIYESTSTPAYGVTTGTVLALYGDFKQYAIVDRIGMSVMYEPMVKDPTTARPTGQGGWFAFWRVGADALVPGAFRKLIAK